MANAALKPRNLDQRFIERLALADKPYIVRDTKIRGLMIAVNKTSMSYKVQRDLYRGPRVRTKTRHQRSR